MMYYTSKNPQWLSILAPEEVNNEELFRIVIFYVFHSPCEGLSAMGKTLSCYGWNTPWSKPFYLNKQLKASASNFEILYSANKYGTMSEALEKAELTDDFPSDLGRERICFYNNQKNQFMSVFYHIRNAFAYGRLNIFDVNGDCTFVLEDVNSRMKDSNGNIAVSARMILKKQTLLSWIDIIENGETAYNKQ